MQACLPCFRGHAQVGVVRHALRVPLLHQPPCQPFFPLFLILGWLEPQSFAMVVPPPRSPPLFHLVFCPLTRSFFLLLMFVFMFSDHQNNLCKRNGMDKPVFFLYSGTVAKYLCWKNQNVYCLRGRVRSGFMSSRICLLIAKRVRLPLSLSLNLYLLLQTLGSNC